MIFPDDADGSVLRRLQERGFDFSQPALIDFNVDFEEWPPVPQAVSILSAQYPSAKVYQPDGDDPGYLQFQVYNRLTYDLVTTIQRHVTDLMAPFHGECTSWGVTH